MLENNKEQVKAYTSKTVIAQKKNCDIDVFLPKGAFQPTQSASGRKVEAFLV